MSTAVALFKKVIIYIVVFITILAVVAVVLSLFSSTYQVLPNFAKSYFMVALGIVAFKIIQKALQDS